MRKWYIGMYTKLLHINENQWVCLVCSPSKHAQRTAESPVSTQSEFWTYAASKGTESIPDPLIQSGHSSIRVRSFALSIGDFNIGSFVSQRNRYIVTILRKSRQLKRMRT